MVSDSSVNIYIFFITCVLVSSCETADVRNASQITKLQLHLVSINKKQY